MKKLLLTFISLVTFMLQIHCISLDEYIQQNGMPQVRGGILNLARKNLTDLTGLQNIPNINQVISLDLSENQLQTLSDNIFNGLQNLQYLYLTNNQLQTLPANIFNGLHKLRLLSLGFNQLQTLPDNVFNDLDQLTVLYCRNPFRPDFIPTLNNMIQGIPNLRDLNGKRKNQALREQPFVTLKRLMAENIAKNIDAYRHRLHELPSDVLDLLPLTE